MSTDELGPIEPDLSGYELWYVSADGSRTVLSAEQHTPDELIEVEPFTFIRWGDYVAAMRRYAEKCRGNQDGPID